MLRRFQDVPFRRKVMTLMTLTAVTTILAATAALTVTDLVFYKRSLLAQNRALAALVASSSIGALEFGDKNAARETLGALAAQPHVRQGCLYDAAGGLVAGYAPDAEAPNAEAPQCPARALATRLEEFRDAELVLAQPVTFNGRLLGSVLLRADLRDLSQRLRTLMFTATVVLALASGLALILSSWFQRLVSRPVLSLADTVERVSREKDYSLRATKGGEDEIGQLIDGFNEMLAQLGGHNEALALSEARLAAQAESLARSNAELDDFAYIASHDLKEPLRGIHNTACFLIEDYGEKLEPEARERLDTLARLSRRMELLIDTLLHYSRVGRTEGAVGPTDLDAVVRDVLDTLQPRLEEKGVEVRVPRPLPTVVCDAARIGEVFRNLITNAMKYNDKSDPWIEIGYRAPADPAGDPEFFVADNGIGIREKHRDAVFRMFKRLQGRDRYGGGTGAGLSIAKKIVERHGGRIWVESVPDQGSRFWFWLGRDLETHA